MPWLTSMQIQTLFTLNNASFLGKFKKGKKTKAKVTQDPSNN